jgi:hypothetical protein
MRQKLLCLPIGAKFAMARGHAAVDACAHRSTLENSKRVYKSMTREVFYAIFGPPGDYITGPIASYVRAYNRLFSHTCLLPASMETPEPHYLSGLPEFIDSVEEDSDSGQAQIRVNSYKSGIVGFTNYRERIRLEQTLSENLISRDKRQWRGSSHTGPQGMCL